VQDTESGLANANGVRQHRLKYRLQLAGRTADDFEYLRGRGLLLQGLRQIVGAQAQFVEQPRILDGNDGLRGKVLHQLNLLVGEGTNFLSIDDKGTNELVVLHHRDSDQRSRTAISARWAWMRLKPVVEDVDQGFASEDAAKADTGVGNESLPFVFSNVSGERGRRVKHGRRVELTLAK
jgi:hypothetical protein